MAAVMCAFAVSNARAQFVTNTATFTAVAYEPGNTTTNSSGSITTYRRIKKMYNTAQLLEEINSAITTNKFSKAAKLVLIVTGNNITFPKFAVIDGTNFYDISPAGYNIVNFGDGVAVLSGTNSNTTLERKLTEVDYSTIDYNDTAYFTNADEGLQFDLAGVGMFNLSDTTTNGAGAYTETCKTSIPNLTGSGINGHYFGTNYFLMSGMVSAAGSTLIK